MNAVLYLAWQHIAFHRLRSLTLVLAMATLITIPLLAEVLTRAAETRMMARAEATPLVYGAAGAPLDLTLSAAYFRGGVETDVSMQDYQWLLEMRLAGLAPIHHAGSAQGMPIIGTDLDYFSLRGLEMAEGRLPVRIGEVALGARAAEILGAGQGDQIVSDVEQVFDLAGAYPVGLQVSGVLAPAGTADDTSILTDLKTGWIVSGLGHGHEELSAQTNAGLLLKGSGDGTITANASLPTLEVIAADEVEAFHFHGAPATFPLSSVLVFPRDRKAAALLQGRVADRDAPVQILRARDQIRGLMDNVFQVARVLRGVMLAVSAAAVLAMALVVWLSVQMRGREFEVARRLGAGPGLPAALVVAELAMLFAAAIVLSLLLVWTATRFENELAMLWMLGG